MRTAKDTVTDLQTDRHADDDSNRTTEPDTLGVNKHFSRQDASRVTLLNADNIN